MARFAPLTLGQLGGTESTTAPPARAVSAGRHRHPQLARLIDAAQDVARRCHTATVLAQDRRGLSKGRLSLLRELEREGPQTVPQLARALLVSRQHVQVLTNSLAESGYVEFAGNPAHKRSRLVRLAATGSELVAELERSERQLFEALLVEADPVDLERAAEVLRRVSSALKAARSQRRRRGGT
jgi:DNA-binding MarR family transcriptional regulator